MKDLEKLEQQLKDMQAEIERLKKADEKVKPLFPSSNSYRVLGDGTYHLDDRLSANAGHARQGNTAYTPNAAEKISLQQAARAYCLEAINQANRGDNGFKVDESNALHGWHHHEKKIMTDFEGSFQSEESGCYLRSGDEAERLQDNPEYVKNWKIAKGIE